MRRALALVPLAVTGLIAACSGGGSTPSGTVASPAVSTSVSSSASTASAASAGSTDGGPGSTASGSASTAAPSPASATGVQGATGAASGERPFRTSEKASFDEPWAMAFLPDGRALVTERGGRLLLVDVATGSTRQVSGTPSVHHARQGGLGDVVLGPDFASARTVYLSWAEDGEGGTSGAAVGRARLSADGSALEGLRVIWRQAPKVAGDGHYGHRLAIAPDGEHLFISSGERQKFTPAQDDAVTLGKIVRTGLDGESPTTWSKGHRNPLGIAFDADGRLWEAEMGPKGGDEVNLVRQGGNYGWPEASNGSHYSGEDIPDHAAGDGFDAPAVWWNPSISPSSLVVYSGSLFPGWRGDGLVGALSGQALVRVDLDGDRAVRAEQWDMGDRIREVEQGPDGAVWLLTDAPTGKLLRLDPA